MGEQRPQRKGTTKNVGYCTKGETKHKRLQITAKSRSGRELE
jgi:hypothetical protein